MRAINAVITMYVVIPYVLKLKAKFSIKRITKNIHPTSFPETDLFPAVSNFMDNAGARHTNSDIVAVIREIHLRLSASGATVKQRKPINAQMANEIISFTLSIFIYIKF
jgi:hypothetical protein